MMSVTMMTRMILPMIGLMNLETEIMMVDTMMQEQMSIGRQSILDMAKLVGANPDANVQTIVQMTKLGLPVTEEMAAQFENYLSDRQALVGEMDLAAGHMMELLSDEALSPETAGAVLSMARAPLASDHALRISPLTACTLKV